MFSEDNQAILLLTGRFGETRSSDPAPLTAIEYGRLARWLHNQGKTPRELMMKPADTIAGWEDPGGVVTAERLVFLFGRGLSMSLALEKWSSAGIWLLARGDQAYPGRLRRRFGDHCPPVLFGVGDSSLLGRGGLSVVGSPEADRQDCDFAERLAGLCASSEMNVFSGGAEGVEETSLLAALRARGTAVGVLADRLMRRALSATWQREIKSGDLCLVSAAYPEADHGRENARDSGRIIYGLSDYGVVVRTGTSGDTWEAASEALSNGQTPIYVWSDSDAAGNAALLKAGGRPLAFPAGSAGADREWLATVLGSKPVVARQGYKQGELFK